MTLIKYLSLIIVLHFLFPVNDKVVAQVFEYPPEQTWRLMQIAQTGGFRELVSGSFDPMGRLYLVDKGANLVFQLNREGMIEKSVGGYGWGNYEFDRPVGIWAENGIDIYVADYGNHRVQRFDRRLSYVGTLENRMTGFENERFGYPVAVAMNRQGELFVADEENMRVIVFGGFDRHLRTFGGLGSGRFRIGNPTKLVIYGDDFVIVQDGRRLLFFDQFGNPYREFTGRFLPEYKDFTVDGQYLYFLMDTHIDIYRGDLTNPVERIVLDTYLPDSGKLEHLTVHRDRLALMSRDRLWIFRILR